MLPPRYCDVPSEQRPTPSLMFVKQLNLNQAPNATTPPQEVQQDPVAAAYYAAQQNRNARHPTMSSMQSAGGRSSSSNGSAVDEYNKEKYRSRPLPMAPGMGMPSNGMAAPPLPAEPMPSVLPMGSRPTSSKTQMAASGGRQNGYPPMNIDVPPRSMRGNNPLVLSPYAPGDSIPADMSAMRCESPVGGSAAVTPEEAYMLAGSNIRQQPSGPLHTPITSPYGGSHMSNGLDDDDIRYYKESNMRSIDRDALHDGGMYRVRKNSSIKHYR
ncbi:hypothetical protein H4R20_006447 [Coemansia guatemalensis]|uniref:Uncharacterized protein n=1 Tax=Coemansia guatemalensis TaxID=2761395 RepID=A0A9W8LQU6_9FUNG|nr:hypothetical protein H4R20_006447 [Coemansia guatemalensis]